MIGSVLLLTYNLKKKQKNNTTCCMFDGCAGVSTSTASGSKMCCCTASHLSAANIFTRTKRECRVESGAGASGKPFQLIPKHLTSQWVSFNLPVTVSPTLSDSRCTPCALDLSAVDVFVHESMAHYPEPNLYDSKGHKGPHTASGFTHPTSQVSFLWVSSG